MISNLCKTGVLATVPQKVLCEIQHRTGKECGSVPSDSKLWETMKYPTGT